MLIVSVQTTKRTVVPFAILFFLCLPVFSLTANAADVTFTATFETPSCVVSAPALIDFGDISSQNIKQGISIADPKSLTVTLSSCSGWLKEDQSSGVKVSGTGNTNSGEFLFMLPATSTAVNYGFLLTKALNHTPISNNTFIPTADAVGNLPSDGTTLDLEIALSCGNKCSDSSTQGGALKAAITFSFSYE